MAVPLHRRLVLVRHAEAAPGVLDRERALTARGERQASAIGAWLASSDVVPDRVLVSPARRALQTWDRMRAALPSAPERVADPRIYDNSVDGLLGLLQETADDVLTVVLVGHNPAVAHLAVVLDDGTGSESARSALSVGFPPASVACFDIGTRFRELGPGRATPVDVAVPGS